MRSAAGFLLASSLMICACTKNSEGLRSGELRIGIGAQPSQLDPRFATDAYGERISALVFEPLVRMGPGFTLRPALAESWSYHSKSNSYRFKLRPDIRFSNGQNLTAEDLYFSFAEYSKASNPFSSGLKLIQDLKVTTLDQRLVVEIQLKTASSKFLSSDLPAVRILQKKEVEASPEDFYLKSGGTGEFIIASKTANSILLQRVKNLEQTHKPNWLHFKVVRDEMTRYQKLLNQEIDILSSELSPSKAQLLQQNSKGIRAFPRPGHSTTYLLLNFKDPMVQNLDFRRSLKEGIDRKLIVQKVFSGFATPAHSLMPPSNPFFHKDLSEPVFSQDLARQKIAGLDLKQNNLEIKCSNQSSSLEISKIIADQFSKIGLKVQTRPLEWGALYSQLRKGQFQIALMRWVGIIDPDLYRIALHSSEHPPLGRNRGFYSNPELDLLLDEGTRIDDEVKRKSLYNKIQEMVAGDVAIIPLWWEDQLLLVGPRVLEIEGSDLGDYLHLARVSLKDEAE